MNLTRLVFEHEIAFLTLCSPKTRNALSLEMAGELNHRFSEIDCQEEVKLVVLRGEGHFMAGGDIHYLARALESNIPNEVVKLIDSAHELVMNIRTARAPVLAVVEGSCAGYGVSLLSHCDVAITSDTCRYTLAYSAIGASPDGGVSFTLPKLCGAKRAKELLMFSEPFNACQALEYGLVNQVVPVDDLENEMLAWSTKTLNSSSHALQRIKQLTNQDNKACIAHLQLEKNAFLEGMNSPQLAEGIRAFHEKRPANFKC